MAKATRRQASVFAFLVPDANHVHNQGNLHLKGGIVRGIHIHIQEIDEKELLVFPLYPNVFQLNPKVFQVTPNVFQVPQNAFFYSLYYIPGNPKCIPGTKNYLPGTPKCLPGTTNCLSAVPKCLPGTTAYLPGTSKCPPGTPKCLPGTSKCLSKERVLCYNVNLCGILGGKVLTVMVLINKLCNNY